MEKPKQHAEKERERIEKEEDDFAAEVAKAASGG